MGCILHNKIRIKEIEKIYINASDKLIFNIGDKKYYSWISGKNACICSVTSEKMINILTPLASGLLKHSLNDITNQLSRILPAFKIFEKNNCTTRDVEVFFRIISDNRLFTKIRVKYEANIPRIIKKLSQDFNITSLTLEPLLRGNDTISEILSRDNYIRAREYLDLLDFIDRRHLLD